MKDISEHWKKQAWIRTSSSRRSSKRARNRHRSSDSKRTGRIREEETSHSRAVRNRTHGKEVLETKVPVLESRGGVPQISRGQVMVAQDGEMIPRAKKRIPQVTGTSALFDSRVINFHISFSVYDHERFWEYA